jgi:hypothetical protein
LKSEYWEMVNELCQTADYIVIFPIFDRNIQKTWWLF